jgi:tetratricopeptide (TPR) repeat protein
MDVESSKRIQIFISYGRQDASAFSKRLADWLRSQGYQPWLDVENGIPAGARFDTRLEAGIAESNLLIALLSPGSLHPEGFCRNELLFAIDKRIPIIPVRIAEVTPPIQIISLNYIDVASNPDLAFQQLPAAIAQALSTGKSSLREWPSADSHPPWWTTLRPLTFAEELSRYGGSIVGRQWLFTQLSWWIKRPESRILLLTADAGVGKSAITAQMTARLHVCGVHFCSHSNSDSCRSVAWVASLVYQLATQFACYREHIEQLPEPRWEQPESLFRTLITDPLRACEQQLDIREPWVFIIDGLDESVAVAGLDLANLLANAANILPPWLRLIVTSRPDQKLLAMFRVDGVQCDHLDAEGERNMADLQAYIVERIERMSSLDLPRDRRSQLMDRLVSSAMGNFLFAKMALDALTDPDPVYRLDPYEAGTFPGRLGGLYHAMFQKRFLPEETRYEQDLQRYEQQVLPLLNCLIAAHDPIPMSLLMEATGLDERVAHNGLLALSQFLKRSEAGVSLFHKSVVDWLMDKSASAEFAASLQAGHQQLAEACWVAYRQNANPMTPYVWKHLPVHLAEAGRWDDLLMVVKQGNLNLLDRWNERGEFQAGLSCMMGLVDYLQRQHQEPDMAGGLATQIARIYSVRGQYPEAEQWLKQALDMASWRQGRRMRAIAYHELGSLYLYQGDVATAEHAYRRALRLCSMMLPRYDDEAAANLLGLATIRLDQYRYDQALRFARRALHKAQQAGDMPHTIAAHRILANALKDLEQYDDTEGHLQPALILAKIADLPKEIAALHDIQGWMHYNRTVLRGEPPTESMTFFHKAIAAAQRVSYVAYIGEARLGLAYCALAIMDTDSAQHWAEHAAGILSSRPPSSLLARLHLCRAAIQHQFGHHDIASKLYDATIALCQKHGEIAREADAWVGLGAMHWHAQAFIEAEACWETARKIAARCAPIRARLVEFSIAKSRIEPLWTLR